MAFSRSNSCRSMSPAESPQKGFLSPSGKLRAARRNKPNAENVPPNTPPPSAKSSSKAASKPATPAQSPGLPPRPPSASNKLAKRKLQWDAQAPQNLENSTLETSSEVPGDTGVTVVLRVRPFSKKESQDQSINIITNASADSLVLGDQQFTFDAVSGEESTQEEMFQLLGLPMVENCLAGFNSSIFAYGQTGSGKTYTMWGVIHDPKSGKPLSDERGITPRVFETLFTRIREEEAKNTDKQLCYQCRCSFLEIYNEQIADLLEPTHRNLQIREDVRTGVYVDNLTEEYVSNMDDVSRLLLKGLGNRRMGSTSMNVESSRSHTVFTCVLECRYKTIGEGMSSVRRSRINLVDLAGSERQKQSGAAGERLKEAGNINRSLSQLGNVINILAEIAQTGKQRHVPYRDSRLTFLLQESLGGNAKLAMICAISPADCCKSESTSTLRFAQRAKAIKNKAVVNEETTTDSNLLREQIRQLKDELKRMKSREKLQGGGDGAYSNGCNARRSYNLLRLSLALPMTLPTTAESDSDEEMEIDEDAVEGKEMVQSSAQEQDTLNTESCVPAESPTDVVPAESATDIVPASESTTDTVPYEPDAARTRRSQALRASIRASRCLSEGTQVTDRIAASLQRGLQVLEEDVRFSFRAPDELENRDHSPERMPQAVFEQENVDSQARREVEELQEALELAMTGHAKLLEQYAELQEKHVALVTKQRRIREGVNDVREMAARAGANGSQLRWLESQAAQVIALNLEREQEREAAREEIEFLQSQLNDTAEAVQAAGELLVRLKEAEEAVAIANDAAALAAQDADRMQREMEKMKRRHATEMATLQQRLLESRLQRAAACPMCVMAERVKFEFTEVDPETAAAALEAENDAAALERGEDDIEEEFFDEEYKSEHQEEAETLSGTAWECGLAGELPVIEEEEEQAVVAEEEPRKIKTITAEIHEEIHDDLYDESDDRCNF